jgi:hypothetical protein
MADTTYQTKVYTKQGADEQVIASGGTFTAESGSTANHRRHVPDRRRHRHVHRRAAEHRRHRRTHHRHCGPRRRRRDPRHVVRIRSAGVRWCRNPHAGCADLHRPGVECVFQNRRRRLRGHLRNGRQPDRQQHADIRRRWRSDRVDGGRVRREPPLARPVQRRRGSQHRVIPQGRSMITYSITTTSDPAEEPITTAEAKSQARIDIADDDTLVASFIVAARLEAESMARPAAGHADDRYVLRLLAARRVLHRHPAGNPPAGRTGAVHYPYQILRRRRHAHHVGRRQLPYRFERTVTAYRAGVRLLLPHFADQPARRHPSAVSRRIRRSERGPCRH